MENYFGAFLKQKRLEKNLTQKQLAEKLYVSESAVSKWEKGVSHPDITLLPKLSAILEVTEHELITASIDESARKDKKDAKKWRALSTVWSTFFLISYIVALIPCFICNLAINKTLSWFFIVFFALFLAFTFTNLPKLIKKHKLLLIPTSELAALIMLLGVIAIYTRGSWFFVAITSILFAFIAVFTPIYVQKYAPQKIKKYNDFFSIFVSFVVLNVLLLVVYFYTLNNGYSAKNWYVNLGLPISFAVYIVLNIFLSVRFLRLNKLIKTSIILFLSILVVYVPPIFIKTSNASLNKELFELNLFNSNLKVWELDSTLEPNIHLIVALSVLVLSIAFLIFGVLRRKNK